MLTSALFRFGNKLYYKSYLSSIAYGGRTAKRNVETRPARPFFELPKWLPSDFRTVLSKDHKLFLREPSQWAQFSVLLALLLIYLLNLKYFPTDVSDSFWKTIIGFGNFAFSGFILATLSVRFVYPTLSLEGKAFWAILSSPMPLKRVFWEKFWSAFLIFLLISDLLAFVSNIMLNIHGIIMILTFFSVLLMSASLTSLSIGLGAMFPQFDEKNPGKIASSVGGMLTTVISLIYVGLVVAIAALPAHRYSMHVLDKSLPFPQFEVILAIILTVSLNLIVIFLPLRLGLSSMRKRDY